MKNQIAELTPEEFVFLLKKLDLGEKVNQLLINKVNEYFVQLFFKEFAVRDEFVKCRDEKYRNAAFEKFRSENFRRIFSD